MSTRPQISVYTTSGATAPATVVTPIVFSAPIRPDLIHDVYTKVAKNKRQAYAVASNAGEQTSAESWGTGRAVARIPRVGGSGTHRSGQAAFGNMCRGGRMFAPTKIWRKWHVKVNHQQKRYATASAIAASTVAPLVLARGHKVERIPEVPLVVESSFEATQKTKDAIAVLKALGAHPDVARVIASKTLRSGKGKMRGRRYTQRKGPLVVYGEDKGLVKALRNVPGVETSSVEALNLLQLAPGAHVGRFIIWTESAVAKLDAIYESKSGFKFPENVISNTDISRIINSEEIQAATRPAKAAFTEKPAAKSNPLKNKQAMLKLNPYAAAFAAKKVTKTATKGSKPSKAFFEVFNQN